MAPHTQNGPSRDACPQMPQHMSAYMCHELRLMVRISQGGRQQKISRRQWGRHTCCGCFYPNTSTVKKKRKSATAVCLEHTILGRKSVPRSPMYQKPTGGSPYPRPGTSRCPQHRSKSAYGSVVGRQHQEGRPSHDRSSQGQCQVPAVRTQ